MRKVKGRGILIISNKLLTKWLNLPSGTRVYTVLPPDPERLLQDSFRVILEGDLLPKAYEGGVLQVVRLKQKIVTEIE